MVSLGNLTGEAFFNQARGASAEGSVVVGGWQFIGKTAAYLYMLVDR